MKNPNGYGCVTKLSGKRRKPWRVRKTAGRVSTDPKIIETLPNDHQKQRNYSALKQRYINIGYFASRKEALLALAEYNARYGPVCESNMTFYEVYEKWSEVHFPKICDTNIRGYAAAFKCCAMLYDKPVVEIKLADLQNLMDKSGKNTPSLNKIKNLLGLMWDYCVMNEILPYEKRELIRYVDTSKPGNPDGFERIPFSEEEIQLLWNNRRQNDTVEIVLLLLYTGCRISELLNLKKENVNLEDRFFDITASKTEAGIRKVPINDKIFPIIKKWYNKKTCEYLVCTYRGQHFKYKNFMDAYWNPTMKKYGMQHRPHDTRHTFVSMLAAADVDERIIKRIVGHKGTGC